MISGVVVLRATGELTCLYAILGGIFSRIMYNQRSHLTKIPNSSKAVATAIQNSCNPRSIAHISNLAIPDWSGDHCL